MTQARTSANRRNAKASTGPRSPAGKARSSRNARRHGATGTPPEAQVITWFRVILGNPEVGPSDLLRSDRRSMLALRLAEAEAQLCATRYALEHPREEKAPPDPRVLRSIEAFDRFLDSLVNDTPLPVETPQDIADEAEIPYDEWLRYVDREQEEDQPSPRLLRRYEREAQGRRDRAFASWIQHLEEARIEDQHDRNAAVGQSPVAGHSHGNQELRLPKRSHLQPRVEGGE